jgi:LPXTG-motif cell wall-anchored protein
VIDVFGNPVTTTVTDANGFYVFENLPLGSYKVTVTYPDGYAPTVAGRGDVAADSSTDSVISAALAFDGDSDMTLDFGLVLPRVSVGDFVWVDTNRDGIQDVDEPGLAGVTLSIAKADGSAVTNVFGQLVTTTVTNANGFYIFEDLPVGSYTVTVVPPAGYVPTTTSAGTSETDSSTGTATSVNLTVDGDSDMTLDFGFVLPMVSVGNRVWFDTNHDGIQDPDEPGIAGVTLSITTADGLPVTDVFGNPVTTTVTDAAGLYVFANLPVGSYKVTVIDPAGLVPTTTGAGTPETDSSTGSAVSVNLTVDGSSDMSLDFGFREPKGAVGNLVWFDINNDGIQDIGEPGIAGVTVSITTAGGLPVTDVFGNPVTSTVTDAAGRYLFDNLPIGSYKVTVETPDGYQPTVAGAGDDPASDSSTGEATSSELSVENPSDLTLDFGFIAPWVSLGNLVWLDTDRDGIQGDGEPGIAGVTLLITKMDGTPVTNVFGNLVGPLITDQSGQFLFDYLPPGQYVVHVETPIGYAPTVAGEGTAETDSATGSDTSIVLPNHGDSDMTLDFGFYLLPPPPPPQAVALAPAPTASPPLPPASVSVGDFVWLDTNRNGIQDVGELGIPGVTLYITRSDGGSVTNVFGERVISTITDAQGRYVFADLPFGSYKVYVVTPDGFLATLAGIGSRESDSNDQFAVSMELSVDGASDLTLDFGFYRRVEAISEPATLPQTGANSSMMVFAAFGMLIVGGLLLLMRPRRAQNRRILSGLCEARTQNLGARFSRVRSDRLKVAVVL